MIIEETGRNIPEEQLRSDFRKHMNKPNHDFNKELMNPIHATDVLSDYGIKTKVSRNVSLESLKELVTSKAALVGFKNPGHRVLLGKIVGDKYYVLDPDPIYNGNVTIMTQDQFSDKYNEQAIVISPR